MDAGRDVAPTTSTRVALAGALAAGAIALILHLVSTPYHFVFDDGAIALRYALRIATGEGFSYGGGEAVHGASPVLAVVTSAGLIAAGLDLAATVRVIAGACLAAAAATLAWSALRRFGPGTALFGLALLLATPFHNMLLHDGLEAPFLLALMVALWATLDRRRPIVHGLLLGLLVQNKVDAALAAIVYAADRTVRDRRFPVATAAIALASCIPFAVWLFVAVGTVLPHSGVHKATVHENRAGFEPTWMLEQVGESAWLAVAVALVAMVALSTWRARPAVVVLAGWAALHLAFFTLVDMGDTFRWYAAQPVYAAMLIAVDTLGRLERRWHDAGRPRPVAAGVPLAATALFLATVGGRELWSQVSRSPNEIELPNYQHANLALQAAGAWLRENSSGTERVALTHGFPALEYGGPVIDLTGLNSPRDAAERLDHAYSITVLDPSMVAAAGTRSIPGYLTVASFRFGPRHEAFVLARPDSEIARSGVRSTAYSPDFQARDGHRQALVSSNGIRWTGPERVRFDLPDPRPTLLALRVDGDASDAGRLTLHLGDAPLASAAAGEELHLALDPARASAATTLELEVTGLEPGQSFSVSNLILRTGEPIRSEQLRLTSPRQAARVDAYAERGLLGQP